jgi:hypothetical protein
MILSRSIQALEMRALGSWGGPSAVGIARARTAKERKVKKAILTGENMIVVDRYGKRTL